MAWVTNYTYNGGLLTDCFERLTLLLKLKFFSNYTRFVRAVLREFVEPLLGGEILTCTHIHTIDVTIQNGSFVKKINKTSVSFKAFLYICACTFNICSTIRDK